MAKKQKRATTTSGPAKFFDVVKAMIESASKKYQVSPYNVTFSQFWTCDKGGVTEWDMRKHGGFTSIRDILFPPPIEAIDSGILPRSNSSKLKLKPAKLLNFTVHEANIKELFKLAKLKDDEVLRVAVQPDTHVPEHDPDAVDAFCEFLKYYKPHGLINLGDFLEMDAVSHWPSHDVSPRRLVPQIEKGQEVLTQIDKAAGPQCVFKRFIIGNHEDWLDQYLVTQIPEVLDGLERLGPRLDIQSLLRLKDYGYRAIPLNEILKLGEAHFIHGYYTAKNHAAKHLAVFGCNIYYGHLHDIQSHSEVNVRSVHEAASLGCLRSLNAPFLKGKPNNWSHSFTIMEFRKDGTYTRYTPIIIDGTFSFNGRIFGKKYGQGKRKKR